MSGEVVERKVRHIGTWLDDAVSDNIIRYINKVMSVEKGRKVILRLSKEGLRILKTTPLDGKSLQDMIPLNCIFYITVNQLNNVNMLVITQHRSRKFQIMAFCCATAVDAGHFVQTFKEIKKVGIRNNGSQNNAFRVRSPQNVQTHRVIHNFSDLNRTPNGGIDVKVASRNAGTDVSSPEIRTETKSSIKMFETTTEDIIEREDVDVSGEILHNVAVQTPNTEIFDIISTTSSLDLSKDLEDANSDLRDIKFLLEKSSGIAADENANDLDDITNLERKSFGTQTIQYRKKVIDASTEDIPKTTNTNSLNFSEWSKVAQADVANSSENLFHNVNGKVAMNGQVPESPKANAKVTFDPAVVSHHSRSNSVQSRRYRPLSTFIERPIETVYPKRPSLKGSLIYRMGRANSLGRMQPNPFLAPQVHIHSAEIKRQRSDVVLKKQDTKTGNNASNGNAHVTS